MFYGFKGLPIERFFVRFHSKYSTRSKHNHILRPIFLSKCRVMQDSFFNRIAHVWNSLPCECVNAKSVTVLHKSLDKIAETQLLPKRQSLLRYDYSENCRVVGCKSCA